jgi:hypothetical protein
MSPQELAEEKHHARDVKHQEEMGKTDDMVKSTPIIFVLTAWCVVGLPLAWGIYKTLGNVSKFFV